MNECLLVVGTNHAIRIVFGSLSAQAGLGVALLRVAVEVNAAHDAALDAELELAGEVRFGPGDYLGQIAPLTILRFNRHIFREPLRFELTDRQLDLVEERRSLDGGFEIFFDLRGFVIKDGEKQAVSCQLPNYKVSQSDWLPILEQIGYDRRLSIEFPMPDAKRQPALAKAITHLEKAKAYLGTRSPRDVTMECRLALDALKQKSEELHGETYREIQQRIKEVPREQLDKVARFNLVSQAVRAATDLAAHPEVDELRRSDAVALIMMVAAIVHQLLDD